MNRNVILKTFDEVRYFHKRILFAVTLKEKVTFLILSNEPIFDIENLRNYLIENELNHFAKNEIINLIELIDSFLKFEKSYNEIPKSENHYSYEYPTKGKGVGSGNLMYILKVNNQFLKSNEIDFNLKEPLYSRLKSLNYFNISSRLLEIKDLFATYLEQPKQPKSFKPKKTLVEFINNINDKEAFLQDLKITFPTEIGKSIKAIIDLLKKDKYLIHNDREFSDVVNAIKLFFNRDIGSIQSIRDAKNTDDKIFKEPIELKLNPLIIKHKTT